MAETAPEVWRSTVRRRAAIAGAVLLVWSVVIAGRLVVLQVFEREAWEKYARNRHLRESLIPAKRGDIVDRSGRLMTVTAELPTITANPRQVESVDATIASLCGALGDCTPEIRREIHDDLSSGKGFVYVRRRVRPEQADAVAGLKLHGIDSQFELVRQYPNLQLASHVLGSLGTDEMPLGGLEYSYDKRLKGEDGRLIQQRDGKGNAFATRIEAPPVAGTKLESTIDLTLQSDVEREIANAVRENEAAGGCAVVMQPFTGEIFALACYPGFDPNEPRQAGGRIRNPAAEDYYEPGSTLKFVTAAAALEEKVVSPDEIIDTKGGRIVFGPGNVLQDTHISRALTFTDAIAKSSNVATFQVAKRLGPERLVDFFKRFGLGRRTSPSREFPGESAGKLPAASDLKSDSTLARAAIGYSVGVTPLQMAAALSSIANGGELVEPRLVRALISNDERLQIERRVVNRTVSPGVAAQTTRIMEMVVDNGTGTYAQVPGYRVAGKTGTAEKLIGGSYSTRDHYASFVGFVPSESPAFTIVVVIDSPHGPKGHFGGPVAGPVFKHIAEAALRYAGIPPTVNAPPPLIVKRQAQGAHEQPTSASLAPPTQLSAAERLRAANGSVPDVVGLSGSEAISVLAKVGIRAKVKGSGIVILQQPEPGTSLEARARTTATVFLGRSRIGSDTGGR